MIWQLKYMNSRQGTYFMSTFPVDSNNETNTASLVLVLRVVQALLGRPFPLHTCTKIFIALSNPL